MKTVEEHINSINTKLQQLLKKYAALRKENAILTMNWKKEGRMKNIFLIK